MNEEILISASPGETRAVLRSSGRLTEIVIDRICQAPAKGNVYLGRVRKLMGGLGAAFVDIGSDRDGFLPLSGVREAAGDGQYRCISPSQAIHEGAAALVQVRKEAIGGKGPRLSTRIGLPGRYLVYSPYEAGILFSRRLTDPAARERLTAILQGIREGDERIVVRTLAIGAKATEMQRELAGLRELWRRIEEAAYSAEPPACLHNELPLALQLLRDRASANVGRILVDDPGLLSRVTAYCREVLPDLCQRLQLYRDWEPLFETWGTEGEIEQALEPRVSMTSGATIVIERTEALTAIDVNTSQSGGMASFGDTILETNLEAAKEIARQVRLRNLSGLMVVDFVHMDRPGDGERVVQTLRAAVADDPMAVEVGDVSAMGLVEMTRRRERPALDEFLLERCKLCNGRDLKSPITVGLEALRAVVREGRRSPGHCLSLLASSEVVAALDGPGSEAVAEAETALGCSIELKPEARWARHRFDVIVGPLVEG